MGQKFDRRLTALTSLRRNPPGPRQRKPDYSSGRRRLLIEALEDRRVLASHDEVDVVTALRADPNPSNAAAVAYTVTFDQGVTGVDVNDFESLLNGTNRLTVSAVTRVNDAVYDVTVVTGGDGDVQLDVIDDNSIKSVTGNHRLGANGPNNYRFTGSERYTIDKTVPTVGSLSLIGTPAANAAEVEYNISFSEPVVGVDPSDFQLSATGLTGAAITAVAGSGTSYVVQMATGSGDGTIQLSLVDDDTVRDLATNRLNGTGVGGSTVAAALAIDRVLPEVVSISTPQASPTNAELVDFTVTFTESVMNVGLNDFALVSGGTLASAMVTNVSGTGASYTVTVHTGTGDGALQLGISGTPTVSDLAGNAMLATAVGSPSVTIDKTAPSPMYTSLLDPSPTNRSSVRYRIDFPEPVVGVSTSNLQAFTGTSGSDLTGLAVLSVTGSGTTYEVTVESTSGSGPLLVRLVNDGEFSDLAGNAPNVVGPNGAAYVIDRIAPTIEAVTLEDASPTNAASLRFLVTLSESVWDFGLGDIAIDQSGLPSAFVQSVQTLSGTQKVVTVSPGIGEGTLSIDVLARPTTTDYAGNAIAAPANENPAYAVDTRKPSVVDIVLDDATPSNASSLDFSVTFSEPVEDLSASDFALVTSGVVGAAITSISGSGAAYLVTVRSGSGDGTIRLDAVTGGTLRDAQGNTLSSTVTGPVVVIDKTPPAVSSIINSHSLPSNASSSIFTVTFSESVSGVDASDLVLEASGFAGAAIDSVSGSGAVYTVLVSHGSGEGDLRLKLVDNDTITDATATPLGGSGFGAGNANDGTSSSSYLYFDTLAPSIVEVTADQPLHSDLSTVAYTVTFSESVTNVEGKFSLNQVGISGASITSVQQIADERFRVVVNTGGGDGTLQLQLVDDDTIADELENPLGGIGVGDEVLNAPVYQIERDPRRSIIGSVYHDADRDHVRGAAETGVTGLRVYVDLNFDGVWSGDEPYSLTAADDAATAGADETGNYRLENLPLGIYTLRVEPASGWFPSSASAAGVTLDFSSDSETEAVLGVEEDLTRFGGTVFDDVNFNAVRDPGEGGREGWSVFVDANANGVLDSGERSAQTMSDDPVTGGDESGTFSFTDLGPGIHIIRVVRPASYYSVSPTTSVATFSTSTDVVDAEFAAHENITRVSGSLFDDIDADGVRDSGEGPLANLRVYIDVNRNGIRDSGEPSRLTAADGSYEFAHLAPGAMLVGVESPSHLEVTSQRSMVEQLFIADSVSDPSTLLSIDPNTGATLASNFILPSPTYGANIGGLAYDGQSIYVLDATTHSILSVDPASLSIRSSLTPALPAGSYEGLAYVGSSLYLLDAAADRIISLDPTTGSIGSSFDIRSLNANNPLYSGDLDLHRGLGESADGTRLVVTTTSDRRLVIHPGTGLIEATHEGPAPSDDAGLAGSGGLFYVGIRQPARSIDVFDDAGTILRSLSVQAQPDSIAAGGQLRPVASLTLAQDEQVSGVDFGLATSVATISGRQYEDRNGNGVFDADDLALTGVTVFADLNDNAWPDADEPQTVSATDGTYLLEDVAEGTVSIRTVMPANYRAADSYPVANRLFGISPVANGLSPTGWVMKLWELDPQSGAVLASSITEIPYQNAALGLAYDGERLILIDSTLDMLYEVAPDGTVLDSRPLGEPIESPGSPAPAGYTSATDFGPAVIQGSIFTIRNEFGLVLTQYDPETNQFIRRLPVTLDWGLESMPATYQPSVPTASFGVGVSADGQSLVLLTGDDRQMLIDPITGRARFDTAHPATNEGTDLAIDSLGGETFIAFGGQIRVFDDQGSLQRTLTGLPTMYGLAGGVYRDNAATVTVDRPRQTIGNVDHRYGSTLSSMSGTVVRDANGDRALNANESAVEGVTVYLDVNRNGQLDAGEPQTVTSATGEYRFADIAPGDYVVRQVVPSSLLSRAWTDDQTRLFAYIKHSSSDAVIQELDPTTGEVLRQFNSPLPNALAVGMALHDGRLYLSRSTGIDILDADSGALIDTIPLPGGTLDGLAIIGSRAYVTDYSRPIIYVVDLHTRELIEQLDLGLINYDSPGSITPGFSLAEAADGVNLAVTLKSSSDLLIVDPQTGIVLQTLSGISAGAGSTSANGELFEQGQISSDDQLSIDVRDHLGLIRRQIPLPQLGIVYGMGADQVSAAEHRVRVFAEQDLAGLDFGNVDATGQINGVQFIDANENGVYDLNESPAPGVTVFVDYNANDFPDAGEPSAISGVDGTYLISGVPLGQHLVRTLAPDLRPTRVSDVRERLIGLNRIDNVSSPTGYTLSILEIDPATGGLLALQNTQLPVSGVGAAAYDGKQIYMVDNDADWLYELTVDGKVIDRTPLPGMTSPIYSPGPAIIDGTVYLITVGGGMPNQLIRFDPQTNQFYGAMLISHPTENNYVFPTFSAAVSESPDGRSILAFSSSDDRVLVIDPLTARVTQVINLPESNSADYTAATVGGELYIRAAGTSGMTQVYDNQYNLLRVLPSSNTQAMGGATYVDSGIVVDVTGVSPAVADGGYVSTLTSVSGVVRRDSNGNGVNDGDEPAEAGVTVYLDANRNGLLDSGERTTSTAADGSYSFDGLAAGDWIVRILVSPGDQAIANTSETALYSLRVEGGVSTILKHDSITGGVLRQFRAPSAATTLAGLAVNEYGLYYGSREGIWRLDPNTGATRRFVSTTPNAIDGLAAVNGQVYGLRSDTNTIVQYHPLSLEPVAIFDINRINGTNYDLLANLGESTDGIHLITRLPSGGGLRIDPTTGVIVEWLAYNNGTAGIAGAAGELYRSFNSTIRVESERERVIRSLAVGYAPAALAAAYIPAGEHSLRAGQNVDFVAQDFLVTAETPSSTISGIVWSDTDGDAMRDENEPGLAGVVVYLDLDGDDWLDVNEPSQTTLTDDPGTTGINETGQYRFEDVQSGVYQVRQQLLPSHVATAPTQPSLVRDQSYPTDFAYVGFQHHPNDDLRLSATGRYLVYATTRAVLPADANTRRDIYLLDRQTNTHELISVNNDGVQGNGNHFEPDVSADGRYVIYRSGSTNLDPADTNSTHDLYIRDRLLGTTSLLTGGLTGSGAEGNTFDALITPDAQHVFFFSLGTSLVEGDTNGRDDSFVWERATGSVERVSVTSSGAQLTDDSSYGGDITPDGRYIIFESRSAQLVPGDTNSLNDIFWKDRTTGEIRLASTSSTGVAGNGQSQKRSISDDGRWVVFDSSASNLTADPHAGPGNEFQVYLKDMQTGEIKRISKPTISGAYPGNSRRPEISGNGRYIAFESDASLVAGDGNQRVDVYLYDRVTDRLHLASADAGGAAGPGYSNNPVISADGSTLAFTTQVVGTSEAGIVTVDIEQILAGHQLSVLPGSAPSNVDFGQRFVTSEIRGTLWDDENGDGTMDPDEPRLAGRTVFLDLDDDGVHDPEEPAQSTSSDDPLTAAVNEAGTYAFTGLPAGEYAVRQVLPDGWMQTSPLQVEGLTDVIDNGYVPGQNSAAFPYFDAAASDQGRFVAFTTTKSMLPIDTNSFNDLYVMDRTTGDLEMVSVATSGAAGNGPSYNPSISGDGRFVVFRSFASNFSAIDTNGTFDVFVHDRQLGTTTLLSYKPADPTAGEMVGNSFSYNPKISRDGRVVTFWSAAGNLVPGDTNNEFDLFLRDLRAGTIERINRAPSGNQALGGRTHESQPNSDGRFIGFWSWATNLVAGDTNGQADVFVLDRQSGVTERVSVSPDGGQGNASSDHFSMSDDARFVAFQSDATNFTNLSGLVGKQIFLKDRQTGELRLISIGQGDTAPNGSSLYPAISADGRWITYHSFASNLVANDTNATADVFLYDRTTGDTKMLSRSDSGGPSDGPSDWARMSIDGSTILFNSAATNLTDNQAPASGLYIYQTGSDDPYVMTVSPDPGQIIDDANFGSRPEVDLGDAPDSYGTSLSTGGPRHMYDANVLLGNALTIDPETGELESDAGDDGVQFVSSLTAGLNVTLEVLATAAGYLGVWVDFDRDGTFEPEERSEFVLAGGSSATSIQIPVPAGAMIGDTYARFRFSTDHTAVQTPTGLAPDGEVEDYAISITAPSAPSGIGLSRAAINENLDTSAADLLFAELSTSDADTSAGDFHSFALVSGDGDIDNARFVVDGSQLRIRQGEILDYETQPTYSVRVRVTDSTGLSYEAAVQLGVNNLVELTKSNIRINDGSAQRSRVESITIEFDTEVTLQAGAITVTKRGANGGAVGAVITTSLDAQGRTVAHVAFAGANVLYGSLTDGNYELRIDATKIASNSGHGLDANQDGITGDDFRFGTSAADKFFRFYGDYDGDRDVDYTDFAYFRRSLLTTAGNASYNAAFDYDDDDDVDYTDYAYFRRNLLLTLTF